MVGIFNCGQQAADVITANPYSTGLVFHFTSRSAAITLQGDSGSYCSSCVGSNDFEVAGSIVQVNVIGIDISPVQPQFVVLNVAYLVGDFTQVDEGSTVNSESWSSIHCRDLCSAVEDWNGLIKHCYKYVHYPASI